jgi:hypothetical protein
MNSLEIKVERLTGDVRGTMVTMGSFDWRGQQAQKCMCHTDGAHVHVTLCRVSRVSSGVAWVAGARDVHVSG